MTDFQDYKLSISDRAYYYIRQFSIKSIDDALVELITNSGDAYKKKADSINNDVNSPYKQDEINGIDKQTFDVEYGKYKISDTIATTRSILVRDKAIGMTGDEMKDKLFKVGQYSIDDQEARGFFSRGAKDISILGDVTFESIRFGKYSKAIIKQDTTCLLEISDIDVTQEIRNKLELPDNGMTVRIDLLDIHADFTYENIARDLNYNVYLRDILMTKTDCLNLYHFDYLNDKTTVYNQEQLHYDPYTGKLLLDLEFNVPDYPNAKAKFTVYLTDEPIPQPNKEKQLEFGFLVKSESTIHEVSTLQDRFRYHPFINYIFGRLECDYINYLLYDLDKNGASTTNPSTVIDPSRRYGLNRDHPFVQKLLEIPLLRLDFILENINSQLSGENVEVSGLDDMLLDLEKLGFNYLENDTTALSWMPDYQAELIKAIEDTREKYVNVENNTIINTTTNNLTDNDVKLDIMDFERAALADDPNIDLDQYRESHIYIMDNDDTAQIISINLPDVDAESFDVLSNADILKSLTKHISVDKFYANPFIYKLSQNGELVKLYIYERGRIESTVTPENDVIVSEKPFLRIEFTKNIHIKKRYIIQNRNNSVVIQINLHDDIINYYFSKQTNVSEIDELSDIKQNNALVLAQNIMTQAFGEIMLMNKIKKENILLDSHDEISKVRKILDVYEEIINEIQYPINDIIQKYMKINSSNNLKLALAKKEKIVGLVNTMLDDEAINAIVDEKYPTVKTNAVLESGRLDIILSNILNLN